MGRLSFGLGLSLLSITIAEFVTGSTPLTNIIFDPGSFFLFSVPSLLGLYGCGVVLVRETAIRWNKGWPSILLMGLAYGIMEEGVSVHTFFAPVNVTVGVLGSYGKVMGLNLTWAIMISLCHSVFSIALPILISDRLWPAMKGKSIMGRRSVVFVFLAYVFTVFILNLIAPYRPVITYSILLVSVSAAMVYAAGKLPVALFGIGKSSPGVKRYVVLGLFFFPYILLFSTNQRFLPSWVVDLELIIVAFLAYWQLETHHYGNQQQKTAYMVASLLVPVMVFGVADSLTSNPLGFMAVGAMVYVIIRLMRSIRASPATQPLIP